MFVQSKWAQDNFQKMSKNEPVRKLAFLKILIRNRQTDIETEREKGFSN